MQKIGERLRTLRDGIKLPQAKVAALIGTTQATVNRYENSSILPPHKTLLLLADYFDVSLDYIYGRTDKPQGTLYEYRPKVIEDNEEMKRFVEMCFDPNSPVSGKLKNTMMEMFLKEGVDE